MIFIEREKELSVNNKLTSKYLDITHCTQRIVYHPKTSLYFQKKQRFAHLTHHKVPFEQYSQKDRRKLLKIRVCMKF